MKYQKKIGIFLFLSVVIMVIGHLMINAKDLGICKYHDTCTVPLMNSGIPLPIFFGSTLFVLIMLLFTKEAVYNAWKKFALGYIPVALYLIYSSSVLCGKLFCFFTRELVTWYLSVLLVIISLLIITIKSWKHRDKTKAVNKKNDNLDSFITKKEKMDFSDTELIRQAIVSAEGNKSDTEIKETLLQQGFQEKDITKAFDEIKKEETNKK
jgi:hypothetical protein